MSLFRFSLDILRLLFPIFYHLRWFHQVFINCSSVDSTVPFPQRLCDNDPGVMGATLCPLFDLITVDCNSYKDLAISFVSILKQVAERRLPKSYDYHQMPAPFIQVLTSYLFLLLLSILLEGKMHQVVF